MSYAVWEAASSAVRPNTAASPQNATPASIPAIVAKALRFEPRAACLISMTVAGPGTIAMRNAAGMNANRFGITRSSPEPDTVGKRIIRTSDGQWFTGLGHASDRNRRQTPKALL